MLSTEYLVPHPIGAIHEVRRMATRFTWPTDHGQRKFDVCSISAWATGVEVFSFASLLRL